MFSERSRRNYKKPRTRVGNYCNSEELPEGKKRYVSISSWARPGSLASATALAAAASVVHDLHAELRQLNACMDARPEYVSMGSWHNLSKLSRRFESNTCHFIRISSSSIAFSSLVIFDLGSINEYFSVFIGSILRIDHLSLELMALCQWIQITILCIRCLCPCRGRNIYS